MDYSISFLVSLSQDQWALLFFRYCTLVYELILWIFTNIVVILTLAFQKIPKWWVWYYWICPVAWTVYGLIVSQYRDVTEEISVPGETNKPSIKDFIEDYYGFKSDFMGPVAGVLVAFTLFFAFIFAFCIKILNFQTR